MSGPTPVDAHYIEVEGPTWQAVKVRADEDLKDARQKLETPGTGDPAAEFQRGRIAALKAILELPEKQTKARAGMQGAVRLSAP